MNIKCFLHTELGQSHSQKRSVRNLQALVNKQKPSDKLRELTSCCDSPVKNTPRGLFTDHQGSRTPIQGESGERIGHVAFGSRAAQGSQA